MAITNKDVDKLKEVFSTKEEAARRHDEIMITLDQLMKEKETAREDRVFAKAKDNKQDQRLDTLEDRVKKVEAKVG
ncbi:MAG: hypothetical protein ABIA67_03265 [Candidatus Margulisiibacteriota bacterium]